MRKHTLGTLVCFTAATALWIAHPSRAEAEEGALPAKPRTLLLFKALSMDRSLAKGREMLRMGILTLKNNKASAGDAHQMKTEVRKVKHMKVRGLKITLDAIYVKDGKAAAKALKERKVNLVYLTRETGPLLGEVCKLASAGGLLVISGEREHSKRCAALAVVMKDRKPLILVNSKAAESQGAKFSQKLLKLAEKVQ